MPIVTTLHTILRDPDPDQRRVLEQVAGLSDRLVVMSQRGVEFLHEIYGVPLEKIDLIPHGIPERRPIRSRSPSARLDLDGKRILLTYGFLSPNKGMEYVIRALPDILKTHGHSWVFGPLCCVLRNGAVSQDVHHSKQHCHGCWFCLGLHSCPIACRLSNKPRRSFKAHTSHRRGLAHQHPATTESQEEGEGRLLSEVDVCTIMDIRLPTGPIGSRACSIPRPPAVCAPCWPGLRSTANHRGQSTRDGGAPRQECALLLSALLSSTCAIYCSWTIFSN